MKWLIKPKKPKPSNGTIREFNRFCFFPTRALNREDRRYYKVWLEFIKVQQVYTSGIVGGPWFTSFKEIIPKPIIPPRIRKYFH
jgi:hypothetical protein